MQKRSYRMLVSMLVCVMLCPPHAVLALSASATSDVPAKDTVSAQSDDEIKQVAIDDESPESGDFIFGSGEASEDVSGADATEGSAEDVHEGDDQDVGGEQGASEEGDAADGTDASEDDEVLPRVAEENGDDAAAHSEDEGEVGEVNDEEGDAPRAEAEVTDNEGSLVASDDAELGGGGVEGDVDVEHDEAAAAEERSSKASTHTPHANGLDVSGDGVEGDMMDDEGSHDGIDLSLEEVAPPAWQEEVRRVVDEVSVGDMQTEFDPEAFRATLAMFYALSDEDQRALISGALSVDEADVWAARAQAEEKKAARDLMDSRAGEKQAREDYRVSQGQHRDWHMKKVTREAEQKYPSPIRSDFSKSRYYYSAKNRVEDERQKYISSHYQAGIKNDEALKRTFEEYFERRLNDAKFAHTQADEKYRRLEFIWRYQMIASGDFNFSDPIEEVFPAQKAEASQEDQEAYYENAITYRDAAQKLSNAQQLHERYISQVNSYDNAITRDLKIFEDYETRSRRHNSYYYQKIDELSADSANNPAHYSQNWNSINAYKSRIRTSYWGKKAYDQEKKVQNYKLQKIFAQRHADKQSDIVKALVDSVERTRGDFENTFSVSVARYAVEKIRDDRRSEESVARSSYVEQNNYIDRIDRYGYTWIPEQYKSRYSRYAWNKYGEQQELKRLRDANTQKYKKIIDDIGAKYNVFNDLVKEYDDRVLALEREEELRQKRIPEYEALRAVASGYEYAQRYLALRDDLEIAFFTHLYANESLDYDALLAKLASQKRPYSSEIRTIREELARDNQRVTWEEELAIRKADPDYKYRRYHEHDWYDDRAAIGRGSSIAQNRYKKQFAAAQRDMRDYDEEFETFLRELKKEADEAALESYEGWEKFYRMHPLKYSHRKKQLQARLRALTDAESSHGAHVDVAIAKVDAIRSQQADRSVEAMRWLLLTPEGRRSDPLYVHILASEVTTSTSDEVLAISREIVEQPSSGADDDILLALEEIEVTLGASLEKLLDETGREHVIEILSSRDILRNSGEERMRWLFRKMRFWASDAGDLYKERIYAGQYAKSQSADATLSNLEKAQQARDAGEVIQFTIERGSDGLKYLVEDTTHDDESDKGDDAHDADAREEEFKSDADRHLEREVEMVGGDIDHQDVNEILVAMAPKEKEEPRSIVASHATAVKHKKNGWHQAASERQYELMGDGFVYEGTFSKIYTTDAPTDQYDKHNEFSVTLMDGQTVKYVYILPPPVPSTTDLLVYYEDSLRLAFVELVMQEGRGDELHWRILKEGVYISNDEMKGLDINTFKLKEDLLTEEVKSILAEVAYFSLESFLNGEEIGDVSWQIIDIVENGVENYSFEELRSIISQAGYMTQSARGVATAIEVDVFTGGTGVYVGGKFVYKGVRKWISTRKHERRSNVGRLEKGNENRDFLTQAGLRDLKTSEILKLRKWEVDRLESLGRLKKINRDSLSNDVGAKLKKVENSLKSNFRPDDIAGAMKEARGLKIKNKEGKVYDRGSKVDQAKITIDKLVDEVKKELKLKRSENHRELYEEIIRESELIKKNLKEVFAE